MRAFLLLVLGAVAAALAGTMAETFFGALSALLDPSVPRGAVVAFEKECPDGWERYHAASGRFLLGAGEDDDTGEVYELHDDGGASEHMLTVPEMPEHTHDKDGKLLLVMRSRNLTATEVDSKGHDEINIRHGFDMQPMGENMPHENMPPYYVVNFCKRI